MYQHHQHQQIRRIGFIIAGGLACLSMAFGFMPSYAKINQAQAAPGVTLSLRTIIDANATATDGPPSGAALAAKKSINGIAVPFISQPAGGFTGFARDIYVNRWLLLSGRGFDTKANSRDLQLRLIYVEFDWRKTDGTGSGTVTTDNYVSLSDPHKKISSPITNAADKSRLLTGGDYTLRGIGRASDNKTLWTIDTAGNLLHFGADGILIETPHPLAGLADGAVQDIGIFPDGQSLLVASNAGGKIVAQVYTLAGAAKGSPLSYSLDAATDQTRGWMLINDHQALVIEQDNKQNADAKIKRVYLADLSNAPNGVITKTLLVDLLKIDDPHNLGTDKVFGATTNQFGLAPFSYPYQTISTVYPLDAKTLLLMNDNNFPFGTGRDPSKAAPTEIIGVTLPNPLVVQLKDVQE